GNRRLRDDPCPGAPGAHRDGGACRGARRAARARRAAVTLAMLHGLATLGPSPTPAAIPGAGLFTASYLLSICIWTPSLVGVIITLLPNPRGRYDNAIRNIAFFTNLLLMFVMFIAYNQFESFLPNVQYEEKV